jgi:hypothetical protein
MMKNKNNFSILNNPTLFFKSVKISSDTLQLNNLNLYPKEIFKYISNYGVENNNNYITFSIQNEKENTIDNFNSILDTVCKIFGWGYRDFTIEAVMLDNITINPKILYKLNYYFIRYIEEFSLMNVNEKFIYYDDEKNNNKETLNKFKLSFSHKNDSYFDVIYDNSSTNNLIKNDLNWEYTEASPNKYNFMIKVTLKNSLRLEVPISSYLHYCFSNLVLNLDFNKKYFDIIITRLNADLLYTYMSGDYSFNKIADFFKDNQNNIFSIEQYQKLYNKISPNKEDVSNEDFIYLPDIIFTKEELSNYFDELNNILE